MTNLTNHWQLPQHHYFTSNRNYGSVCVSAWNTINMSIQKPSFFNNSSWFNIENTLYSFINHETNQHFSSSPEVYNGRHQSVCTQSQRYHYQPGPPVAGPALPDAPTRPFQVPGAPIPNCGRGSAAGPDSLPLPLSETRGHQGIGHHCCCFNKATQWWACKDDGSYNLSVDIKRQYL